MRMARPHKNELVKQVQAWLQENYAQTFTLDQLAQRFSVSKRTLIRRFNAALSCPPNVYLQSLRIEAAQKLLEETRLSVNLLVNQLGYEDARSFRRLFRHKTGVTPTEYRRRFSRR